MIALLVTLAESLFSKNLVGVLFAWSLATVLLFALGLGSPPPLSFPFHAPTFLMPATPPPSPPPHDESFSSFQLHQEAMRHQEHLHRDTRSPELRRIPSSSTMQSTIISPPRPSVSTSVSFHRQTFHHLPSDLTDRMRNLEPFPIARRNAGPSTSIWQSNVSFTFYLFLITY